MDGDGDGGSTEFTSGFYDVAIMVGGCSTGCSTNQVMIIMAVTFLLVYTL